MSTKLGKSDEFSFDDDLMKTFVQEEFKNILGTISGEKVLILSEDIISRVSSVIPSHILNEYEVKKYFQLKEEVFTSDCPNVIYVVSCRVKYVEWIHNHIQNQNNVEFFILFVPFIPFFMKEMAVKFGENVHFFSFFLNFVSVSQDVFSLEKPRNCCNWEFCRSLFFFLNCECDFSNCFLRGVGEHSTEICKHFHQLVKKKQKQGEMKTPNSDPKGEDEKSATGELKEIDGIFFIDREVDLVSPFLTPLSYEGLLDEFYGIKNGFVKFEGQKIPLKKDMIFSRFRDRNQKHLKEEILSAAGEIDAKINQSKESSSSISDLKNFVKFGLKSLLKQKKALEIHSTLAANINKAITKNNFRTRIHSEHDSLNGDPNWNTIATMIYTAAPASQVLQYLCLGCYIQGGIPEKEWKKLKGLFIRRYGVHSSLILSDMIEKGYITVKKGRSWLGGGEAAKQWQLIIEKHNLIRQQQQNNTPENDVIYQIFDGFAPYSVVLIQKLCGDLWKYREKLIQSPVSSTIIPTSDFTLRSSKEQQTRKNSSKRKKRIVVCYFGGVSIAELNTLRNLSKSDHGKYEFVVFTTKVLSGKSLIRSFFYDENNQLMRAFIQRDKRDWDEVIERQIGRTKSQKILKSLDKQINQ